MTQPDFQTMTTMAQYARHRGALWRLMSGVVGPVTDELVERATTGKLAREVEGAAHFAGDTNPFDDELPSRRDVFEHGRTVDADAERSQLRAELEAAYDETLTPFFVECGKACDDEADAWDSGDDAAAKEARMGQFTVLRERLEALTDWCVALYRSATTKPGKMVARIVAAHLALESGANVKAEVTDS